MPAALTARLLVLTVATSMGACSDEPSEVDPGGTSTGMIDETSTDQVDSSDGVRLPDVFDPHGTVVSGPVDADGCFEHCLSDEMPTNNQIVDPYCTIEIQADGAPVEIPRCEGSTPDDYAVPDGADVCYWVAVDTELWQLTPDDPRDDVAEACKPANASFKFVERVEGTVASSSVYATCATDTDRSSLCCDDNDNC